MTIASWNGHFPRPAETDPYAWPSENKAEELKVAIQPVWPACSAGAASFRLFSSVRFQMCDPYVSQGQSCLLTSQHPSDSAVKCTLGLKVQHSISTPHISICRHIHQFFTCGPLNEIYRYSLSARLFLKSRMLDFLDCACLKKGDPSQSWQIFHFIVISGTSPSHPNLPKTNQTPRAAFSIHQGFNIFNQFHSICQINSNWFTTGVVTTTEKYCTRRNGLDWRCGCCGID